MKIGFRAKLDLAFSLYSPLDRCCIGEYDYAIKVHAEPIVTKTGTIVLLILVYAANVAIAQYGTAPNNYYPVNYNGSTFTGVVAETADDELVLNYTKGSKTEVFRGKFETGCSVPRADHADRKLMPSDIPEGTAMTAFFNSATSKTNGAKLKQNVILAIAFNSVQGEKIADEKKMIYSCTKQTMLHFKAF